MDEPKKYVLVYTESAKNDILEKFDYISQELHSPETAVRWYNHLRDELRKNLSVFPKKYELYRHEPWKSGGIRWMTTKTDIILYSVDEGKNTVYIRWVCTLGRDLDAHMETEPEST